MIATSKRFYTYSLPIKTYATILIQILYAVFLQELVDCSSTNNQTITETIMNRELHNQALKETHGGFSELNTLRNKCNGAEKELDRCSAQLIAFGQSNALYPNNMEQLNSVYCPNFKETVSCIRNNTDCYRPFERQIINWILSSTRRINYKRCKNEDEKLRFLRLTNSCFSQMKHPMNKCMINYVSSLEAIAGLDEYTERLSEDDIQIQLSCCANNRFNQCVMDRAKQRCKPVDSLMKLKRSNSVSSQRMAQKYIQRARLDMMDDLKSTLNSMALTGPELICHGVKEEFCRFKFDGKFNGRISRHKSIIPAMIKIYSNK